VDFERLRRHARREEHDQQVVLVGVDLRALAELARVLERDGVQPERLPELIVPFKRKLYRELLEAFAAYL
jgi:CHASE2 domain-containing sensor protein